MLSFKIIVKSSAQEDALFNASNTIPQLVTPSPITGMISNFSFFIFLEAEKPKANDKAVPACPAINGSQGLSSGLGKPLIPFFVLRVEKKSLLPFIIL